MMPKPTATASKDALVVVLSDMHSGSNSALFPDRFWSGKNGLNHTPTSRQQMIFKQFEAFAEYVRETRKNKRVVLVHDGDAIEGVHHNNVDVCTRDVNEQADLHVELMNLFMKTIGWTKGDLLYYVSGTDTHVGDMEDGIASELGAVQTDDDLFAHDHIQITVNGQPIWFVHHGPKAGKGANEGNALRNWLRDIYWDAVKEHEIAPAMIFTGHVHQPTYNAYIANDGGEYKMLHGVICPSWQAKTRYAYKAAPVARNKIGGVAVEVRADGEIKIPVFKVAETESMKKVVA